MPVHLRTTIGNIAACGEFDPLVSDVDINKVECKECLRIHDEELGILDETND